jgi:hypothetical protein
MSSDRRNFSVKSASDFSWLFTNTANSFERDALRLSKHVLIAMPKFPIPRMNR